MLKRFIVERRSKGIGFLKTEEYCHIAQRANEASDKIGPGIEWLESYVTDNKLYCIYLAENDQLIREHSRIMDMPIDSIEEVRKTIDPTTATLADAPFHPYEEEIYDSIL